MLFGSQSGFQVSAENDSISGLESKPVSGQFAPIDALRIMLNGTDVYYRITGENTVTISTSNTGPDTHLLSPLSIEAAGIIPNQAQLGNLPAPYAGGQVASGGRVGLLGNQDVFDIPFSMTSYTAELIENQSAKTVGDVIANDSSTMSAGPDRGGFETILIRGFNTGGSGSNLYAGLPGLAHRRMSSVGTIERVEVFKGANSLLTGAVGNVGGTVNLEPKRPTEEPLTRIGADYEAVKSFGTHVDVSRRTGKDGEFGIRFTGTVRNGESVPENFSEDFKEGSLSLSYQTDRFRGNVVLDMSKQALDAPNTLLVVGNGVPDAPNANAAVQQPWEARDNSFVRGLMQLEYDIWENVTAYGAIGATEFSDNWLRTIGTGLDANGNFTQIAQLLKHDLENVTGQIGMRGHFETGPVSHALSIETFRHVSKSGQPFANVADFSVAQNLTNPIFVDPPSFSSLSDQFSTDFRSLDDSAAIADVMKFFDERVLLTVGARYQRVKAEDFNSATGAQTSKYDESAITPAVGIVIKPWRALSLYGNYIESLEQGETAPNTVVNAGEVFPPDKTRQIEIGAKYDFGRVGVTAGLFQIEQPNGLIDDSNVFNVDGERRNRGLELNVFGELTEDIRILSGVTLLDAVLTKTQDGQFDGKNAPGTAEVTAVLGLEWDTPMVPNLTLSARANYVSAQFIDTDNIDEVPGYQVYNIGARYSREFGDRKVTFRGNISNLLGEDYWVSFPNTSNILYIGAPRVFSFSAIIDL